MKKFSDRLQADWNNSTALSRILDKYFSDDEIFKTKTSLCVYLNISPREFDRRKKLTEFQELLEMAELCVQEYVEKQGFLQDKSFARFMLETQHGYTKQALNSVDQPKLHIEVSIED